jgi:RNA polymerase sigma factor (sigma-70 family)
MDEEILKHEKLIYHVLHRRFPALDIDDDIMQIGRIGLWQALKSYKPEQGKFSTLACRCIKNQILRDMPPQEHYISLYEPVGRDTTLENYIPDADRISCVETMDWFIRGYRKLKPFEKLVIRLTCVGYKQKDISERTGKTQQYVCKVLKQARMKLMEGYND